MDGRRPWRRHWNIFKQGKSDVVVAALGSAIVNDLNASVPGGVRYTSLDPSPTAFARLDKIYPKGYLKKIKPSPKLTGLVTPIHTRHFDYMLWTHTGQKYATVYKAARAMSYHGGSVRVPTPLAGIRRKMVTKPDPRTSGNACSFGISRIRKSSRS